MGFFSTSAVVATLLPLLVLDVSQVSAHSSLRYLWTKAGDISSATDKCIRKGHYSHLEGIVPSDTWAVGFWYPGHGPNIPDYSVPGVFSPDLACGNNGSIPALSLCDVTAGSTIGVEWHTNYSYSPDPRGDGYVEWPTEENHLGPVMHYLAGPFPKGTTAKSGSIDLTKVDWFKVQEWGFEDGVWGTAAFRAKQVTEKDGPPPYYNSWDVTLPEELAEGEYLLKSELVALHNANWCNVPNGFQSYTRCAQLSVKKPKGKKKTRKGWNFSPVTRFPGAYNEAEKGVFIDVWESLKPNFTYSNIGPTVAKYRPGKPEVYLGKAPEENIVQGCTCPKKPGQHNECR